MGQEIAVISYGELERMSVAVAKSGLFGLKTADQALALMLISQAEGRHPVMAARDYDIIQGKPAKKSEAMLRDFLSAGGKVEIHQLDDTKADMTFSHPQGGSFKCTWDLDRAKKAGLGGKEMWLKWPRQMLRSRCVSEGIRTVFPMATSGMYVPEEAQDIGGTEPMRDVTPPRPTRSAPVTAQPAPNIPPGTTEVDRPQPAESAPQSELLPSQTGAAAKPKIEMVDWDGEIFQADNAGHWLTMILYKLNAEERDKALGVWESNYDLFIRIQGKAISTGNSEIIKQCKTIADRAAELMQVPK